MSADSQGALRFLETIKAVHSTHRASLHLVRQLALLAGSLSIALTGRALEWPYPWLTGLAAGGIAGVLVVETFFARLLALRDPRRALRALAWLIVPVDAVCRPLVRPMLSGFRRFAERGGRNGDDDREEDPDEEVEAFIEVGERDGILEAAEGKMLRGIVDLGETRVREIMTPRTDIVALDAEASVREARALVLSKGHSRLPVYRGSIDNVVGILHVRDLMRAWEEGRDTAEVARHVRPAFFVPETRPVAELLSEMRIRTHIALVVDEYGSLAGLVTLEDLLEEIVGDIRDEHDAEEARVVEQEDGTWLVSGLAHVEEIEPIFGLDLSERGFDTVAGLVMARAGKVPAVGETVETDGMRIEVLQADRQRIFRVRIARAVPDGGGRGEPH